MFKPAEGGLKKTNCTDSLTRLYYDILTYDLEAYTDLSFNQTVLHFVQHAKFAHHIIKLFLYL